LIIVSISRAHHNHKQLTFIVKLDLLTYGKNDFAEISKN